MGNGRIIAGIDIGTSKICVLVGELHGARNLSIIGMSECTAAGVVKGEIVDMEALSDCLQAALDSAERKAEAHIQMAYVSQSGAHLSGFRHPGVTSVTGPESTVSRDDLERAIENAKRREPPLGRLYLHHIRSGYLLDGKPVEQPLHMHGSQLEAQYWHVQGDERQIKATLDIVHGCGVHVEDMVSSSMASGTLVTANAEKQIGVVAVDIGAGSTDWVLYKNGRVLETGVLPVGGQHLTNDLSLGLRINFKQAESLKLRYGKARIDKTDQGESVMLIGDLMIGDRPIPRLAIYKILHARVEELFMILKNRLGSQLSETATPAGVVLTGGTANLPLIEDMAASTLGLPVRIGETPRWVTDPQLCKPEYSTVLGLLYYGLTDQMQEEDLQPAQRGGGSSWLGRLTGLFN